MAEPLAARPVGSAFSPGSSADGLDPSPGRRLRVFGALIQHSRYTTPSIIMRNETGALLTAEAEMSHADALAACEADEAARTRLDSLYLRAGGVPTMLLEMGGSPGGSNPSLAEALQDLADEIVEDIREALNAADDPSGYFPGVDSGIEPVPDDHVRMVMWAMQRELNREKRDRFGAMQDPRLPAAQLADLPPLIQRALAERRRLRFAQYGIGRAEWESGKWSLWKVPEDPEWVPRRALRMGVKP